MGCQRLGERTVVDKHAGIDVPVNRVRGEVDGGDEDLPVVLEDRPGAVTRVDGTWVTADVWTPGAGPVPLEVRGEAACDRVGCRGVAVPELDANEQRQCVNWVTRLVDGRSSPIPHTLARPGDHRLVTRLTRVNRKVASDSRDTRTSSPGCAR